MPRFLSNSAIRLLEASQESLALALHCLAIPNRGNLRVEVARYSPAIGLIGAAAEQALAAIIVQVRGDEALATSPTQYKSARQILSDMRDLLRAPIPASSFLTAGVDNPAQHRETILQASEGFSVLFTYRATGLHAGLGVSRTVTLKQAFKVYDFLELLTKSTRIRPYMDRLPIPPDEIIDQNVLIDDLIQKFQSNDAMTERVNALRSLFLILPEVPQEAPEWLEAFDRSVVSPRPADITLLLETLQHAAPMRFRRINADGQALPVVVRPNDPNALPIALQDMRQAFGHAREQFGADVGNANGRLDQGNLDLPPESFLLDLCLQGPEQLRETLQRQTLTGQEVWPFVATALSQQGTERPYWFLVSMVDDIGQLIGQLRRAVAVSRQDQFKERCNAAIRALDAKRQERTLAPATEIATFTVAQAAAAEAARDNIPDLMDRNDGTVREASLETIPPLAAFYAGEFTAGQAFPAVYGSDNPASKKYWTRQLLIAATDAGDRSMLITALRDPEFANLKTDARKALRLVDILTFGPNIELG